MDGTCGALRPTVAGGGGGAPLRVLLVTSSGGVTLDLAALRPWWARHERTWLAVRDADTEELLAGEEVRWGDERSLGDPVGLVRDLVRAFTALRRSRPDVVVSAGSGIAVAPFVAARALGIPAIWIETFNIVERPGLASRWCGRLAHVVLVQRAALVPLRPRSVLVGELY